MSNYIGIAGKISPSGYDPDSFKDILGSQLKINNEQIDIKGGIKQVDYKNQLYELPLNLCQPGMLVWVNYENTHYIYNGVINGIVTFTPYVITESSDWKDVPMYAENNVPINAPDEYLTFTPNNRDNIFTVDEEKAMMLNAIKTLQEEVARLKRAFTDQMDCGNFENNKISKTVLSTYSDVQSKEPTWASETGEPTGFDNTIQGLVPDETDIPKITHLMIKSGTEKELEDNVQYLLPHELLWCYDTNKLYIKQKSGSLYCLNSTGTVTDPNIPDMSELKDITFISPSNKHWKMQVSDEGDLEVFEDNGTNSEIKPVSVTIQSPNKNRYRLTTNDEGDVKVENQAFEKQSLRDLSESELTMSGNRATEVYLEFLYINSVYCGGTTTDEDSYNPCSHNYVELANLIDPLTAKGYPGGNGTINLKGLSLQYSEGGNVWHVLPLKGEIKQGSTFLIRGARCALDTNTTKVKVENYDMEWLITNHETGELEPIKFNSQKAKFYLTYGTTACEIDDRDGNPMLISGSTRTLNPGYIDFVGFQMENATSETAIKASENNPYSYLNSDRLMYRYFELDSTTQGDRGNTLAKRNNATYWNYVQLDKNYEPDISNKYRPRASFENKSLSTFQTQFSKTKPEMISVAFGIDAHNTRCFNWCSLGYRDEYLYYRKVGDNDWTIVESFKENDNRTKYTSWVYNRLRILSPWKVDYTSHKMIITGLNPDPGNNISNSVQEYEYKVGNEEEGFISEIRKFKVHGKNIKKKWSFVQTTDQQAFTWGEADVWRRSADFIRNDTAPYFMINTGDATQNGQRLGEWLDYFHAADPLINGISGEYNGVEHMYTVGNNDLAPGNPRVLSTGAAATSKINPAYIHYYTCYEMSDDNPAIIVNPENHKEYYVPSCYSFTYNDVFFMSVNSEIAANTSRDVYDGLNVFKFVHDWCQNEVLTERCTSAKWRVMYCHEAPFQLSTNTVIEDFLTRISNQGDKCPNTTFARPGSKLNTGYSSDPFWCSRMLQTHDFRLVLSGHKHTYSCSYPIEENCELIDGKYVSYTGQPYIQVPPGTSASFLSGLSDNQKKLCFVNEVETPTAPIYVMSQATGYKLFSNADIPGAVDGVNNIPWLEAYYKDGGTANPPEQKYPFYIDFVVDPNDDPTQDTIKGHVWRIDNIFLRIDKAFSFNINTADQRVPLYAKIGGNGPYNEGLNPITLKQKGW